MSAWGKIIKLLNEDQDISHPQLKDKIFLTNMITHKNFQEYLHLLVNIGYIGHWRGYFKKYHKGNISYYKLIKKIPEKLTIADARKMKQMPWLEWFKYPE